MSKVRNSVFLEKFTGEPPIPNFFAGPSYRNPLGAYLALDLPIVHCRLWLVAGGIRTPIPYPYPHSHSE
eukprot:scaffold156678_cov46-Tisochrysis_lutea.AAC.1